MARFNTPTSRPKAQGPLSAGTAEVLAQTRTHQGAPGFTRDAKSELFLATVNSFNEGQFYETADARVARIRPLIASLAVVDPEWVRGLISWLRREAHLRSVPTIVAAEAIKARLSAGAPGNRAFVTAAVGRIDEAAEFVAYWHSTYGKRLPMPVKRGIADALTATKGGLTEYGYLKYRGKADRGSISLADLVMLTHPEGKAPWQKALFKQVLEDAYNSKAEISPALPMIRARRDFLALSKDEQIRALTSVMSGGDTIRAAGLTHEVISSALGGVPADVWERLMPTMGYQALLMNLRRIEQSNPPEALIDRIVARLKDPEEVAKSKMLPMRFLAAYRHAPLDFHGALQKAMDYSVDNVPALSGRTLILIDRSASMNQKVSAKSTLTVMDTANIFGAALALRSLKGYSDPTLVTFGTSSKVVPIKGQSLMTLANNPANQGGTDTAAALRAHYNGHDRVIVLTDEQANLDLGLSSRRWYSSPYSENRDVFTVAGIPESVPKHTWNLAGYTASHAPTGKNRFLYGGMNDVMFSMIQRLEQGHDMPWPWEE